MDFADDQYSVAASGNTTGLMNVFAGGRGSRQARHDEQRQAGDGQVRPERDVGQEVDHVRIALSGGNVKDYAAEPPPTPVPDRVPVTDAHRRGVVDPMTGDLMVVPGMATR